MSDFNKSGASAMQQDDEAADLLMLFSNQSKKINTDTDIKSKPPILSTTLPPIPNITNTKDTVSSTITSHPINRQESSTSATNKPINVTRSPGPASAALASGSNSNKAIVAAAALAAAAATPLPILHKIDNLQQTEQLQIQKQNVNVNVKFEELDNPISLKSENNTTAAVSETLATTKGYIIKPDKRSSSGKKNKKKSTKIENDSDADDEDDNKKIIDEKHEVSDHNEDTSPSYAVGPDSGIISCICGYDHDDGLTIQCDKCFRWQHLVCMGFESIVDTPDDFQCNLCNKNLQVDVLKAKRLQEEYLKEEKSKKRKGSTKDNSKDVKKNIGAAQFKKRKVDDNSAALNGVNKYNTLYYPIDYFVFKSSPIKSLFNQLPEILKKEKSFIRVDKANLNKLVLSSSHLNLKNGNEYSKLKFTGVSKLGLYSNKVIKQHMCVSLMTGEVDTKENYILDKINKYWLLGCPKPSVFFHPELPIAIDERGLGNYTRFIRKSCKPNCEIKTILVNKGEIKFGIFSTREIKVDQEITLPWEWDVDHPILAISNNIESFESLTPDRKMILINSIQSILDLTECACLNSSECVINKIKKLSAFLQRNTRKNNLSNLSPTPNQAYIPLDERLNNRFETILNEISESNIGSENDSSISKSNSLENLRDDKNDDADGMIDNSFNFKFKPKSRNTLYNLHILPKQVALIKNYSHSKEEDNETDKVEKAKNIVDVTDVNIGIDIMPIPIEVNSRILQKLKSSSTTKELNATNETGLNHSNSTSDVRIQEKPKIVKKFSLADYKKKKTG